jgi:hypothetical protein
MVRAARKLGLAETLGFAQQKSSIARGVGTYPLPPNRKDQLAPHRTRVERPVVGI